MSKTFSQAVTVFRESWLPVPATPAGYAALIDAYDLRVPIPHTLYAIGDRHKIIEKDGWHILTPRHAPEPTLLGHLTFALKNEGLDLAVLKRLFLACGPKPIEEMVKSRPTGRYSRRIWFLYEWLTNDLLDLPAVETGAYVDALDTAKQYGGTPIASPRHRVRNNLPGTPLFCPLIFRRKELEVFQQANLQQKAMEAAASVPKDLLARTAAFLLLKDSKSSFEIEGERPAHDRIQRWGRAIAESGKTPLSIEEFLRLQRIVIGDDRFVQLGFREEGGFVGIHDRESHMPVPDHISAKPEDLSSLMKGMIDFAQDHAKHLDPVLAAAVLAFGFVYVHPFEDGNGRLHRYLFHHVLAQRGFNPAGVVFPVSSVILERIDDYRQVLEDYSTRLLGKVDWQPTQQGNLTVTNDTADFYRFFDATAHAQFLYACVMQTVEHDLPEEARFLQSHDRFQRELNEVVDMPARLADLLFRFLNQNNGKLSERAKSKEFAALTLEEKELVENIYTRCFDEKI
ncbi:Fic/DOC family protein [Pseudovibrio axinellae]|uniref:Fic/DOC family protein n=1 Tax=Pseudovibrio axinellae TaxID=989403 RepID=A0A165XPU1_9HYPH|nr:Fic family protein [Pseudovibrio axinellae]KZL17926.1 Fic/DOC family protein [Pseudovibrio axinellae]SER76507.1 Fic/DOC family protein [Pseudovibrio axinellae]